MASRPNVKTERLRELYLASLPFEEIAKQYGGTPQGVRSTIRKMIDRGDVRQRPQRRNHYTGRFS